MQDALNKASQGRTVILIAHRLSTVINTEKIAVVDNGQIIEIGKHEDLIKKKRSLLLTSEQSTLRRALIM